MDLCRLLHEEIGLFPMNEDVVREYVACAINKTATDLVPNPPILGVIPGENRLEGAICMVLSSMWYAPEHCHLEELFNFVHPDHRKSGHVDRLIAFGKDCSDRVGVPLMIGIISNSRTAAKCRLYSRVLPKVGEFFFYRDAA